MPENPENPLKPPAKGGAPSEITRENFPEVLAAAAEKLAPRPETSIARVAGRKIITGALVWPDRTLYNLAEKPEGTAQKTALELFYNLGTTPEQLAAVRQRLEENRAVSTPAGTLSPSQDSKILLNQTIDALTGFREQHQNVSRLYSFYHGRSLPTKGVQGRAAAVSGRVRRLVTKPARAVGRTLAKTGVGQAVKKGATWLATRLGLATFGNLIAPGVATIIGLAWIAFDVVKYLIKKILDDPIKAIAAGVALLAGALLLPLPFLLKLPLLALGALLGAAPFLGSLAGLTAAAGTAFVSFIVMLIPFIVAPLLTTLGAAVVVTAVVVFGLTAWFMHASTAARFLVGGAVPSAEAAQFDVAKQVAPKMEFENSELPVTLTYTITIVPLGGVRLLNVTVEEKTTVLREINPPTIAPRSWTIASLNATWTQTYNQTLDSRFSDSLIVNTVTVTADVEGGPAREQESESLTVRVGSPPQDCPSGWPTRSGYITQGPEGSYSHQGQEAIDIGVSNLPGVPALATHQGIARVSYNAGGAGNRVDIDGACKLADGRVVPITTHYAHLAQILVTGGQAVRYGDSVGIVGDTGCPGCGVHLHYEFLRNLTMTPSYIPRSVDYGCSGYVNCGSIFW